MTISEVSETPEMVERILEHALRESDYPDSFFMLGRQWDLYRDVFPPTMTAATEVMASIVPYPPGGRFLEMGSGAGVIAVTAALAGCESVTALDINGRAVANTRANARRHGVAGRVRTMQSDLFEVLDPTDRFDAIFWNIPWTYVQESFELRTALHVAVFDPGYRGHANYIADAWSHLTATGRLFIGTADLGDRALLCSLAAGAGMRISLVERVRRVEVHRVMEYDLIELHRL